MPVPKPTLYCIVAINVADISIGPACTVDRNRITGFFKKLTDFIELPYKEIQIDNKDFTVDGVKTAIKSIDPASNDIVVFAYSGHGFRFSNETGLFPQLAACNKVEGGFFAFSFFQFLEAAFEAGNTGLDGIINRAAEFASVRSGRAICGDKPCMQNVIFRTVA